MKFGFHFLGFATIFYRALCPTPNLEDQVPIFMSSSDRVAQLYPQAQCFLFITFYDLQGYGGGILTHLHMDKMIIISC
jgi:hypothetical protein